MADVFISYKSERRPVVQHLATILRLHGYSVWFDYSLLSGKDFAGQIEREIRAAKVVLVLWCPLSVGSEWVKEEAGFARELGRILPSRLEQVELPFGFRMLETIDLSGWDGAPRSHWLDRLVLEIGRFVGRDPLLNLRDATEFEATWRRYGAPRPTAFRLDQTQAELQDPAKAPHWALVTPQTQPPGRDPPTKSGATAMPQQQNDEISNPLESDRTSVNARWAIRGAAVGGAAGVMNGIACQVLTGDWIFLPTLGSGGLLVLVLGRYLRTYQAITKREHLRLWYFLAPLHQACLLLAVIVARIDKPSYFSSGDVAFFSFVYVLTLSVCLIVFLRPGVFAGWRPSIGLFRTIILMVAAACAGGWIFLATRSADLFHNLDQGLNLFASVQLPVFAAVGFWAFRLFARERVSVQAPAGRPWPASRRP